MLTPVYCLFIEDIEDAMELHGVYTTREKAKEALKDHVHEFWDTLTSFEEKPTRDEAWASFRDDDNARQWRIEGYRLDT